LETTDIRLRGLGIKAIQLLVIANMQIDNPLGQGPIDCKEIDNNQLIAELRNRQQ
jgi:GTP cyclohydrolase II